VKTLRPNPIADRELRLFGKYRVLFRVDSPARVVTIVLVEEKRGRALAGQGRVYTEHHETDSTESLVVVEAFGDQAR
jgi:hypothetical protein